MSQELENIICELSCHDPSVDWSGMVARINAACNAIDPSIAHGKFIRGALLSFVASRGIENEKDFLLGIAKTELLKMGWSI